MWSRIQSLWRRPALKREIDQELRFHLERRTAENLAAGLSPEDAAREARRRFGNVQSVREECRDVRGASLGEGVLHDFRCGARMLLRNPGFTAVVAATLGLGVAAVTTIFAFISSILLNPLPYPDSDELIQLCDHQRKENQRSVQVSIPDLMDWKQQSTAFSDLAYFGVGTTALTGGGDAEPVQTVRVSEGFLSALRVKPLVGAWFVADDYAPGPDRVCLISYSLWKRRFGSDLSIIGKSLVLNGNSVTIAGVMPGTFDFPEKADVALTSGFINWEKTHRELRWYQAIGRLKPGVSLATAQAELDGVAKRLEEEHPATNAGRGVQLVRLKDQIVGDTARALRVLFGAVCCVLVIACANIASLLLVRAIERRREFAVRLALGASRLQVARQQFSESVLLSCLGGAVAILASFWGVKALVGLSPARIPRLGEVHIQPGVLLFCLGISVACGILFGLAPVAQTFRTNVTESLNAEGKGGSGSRETGWGRNAVLLFQIAITVVLMIGAGLFIRSYSRMQRVDLGFDPDQVAVSKIALRTGQYPMDESRARLFRPLLEQLEQLPGKKSIALAARPPFVPPFVVTMGVDGIVQAPGERFTARFNSVSDGYFDTLGMRIIAGRGYNRGDNENSLRVVIVNQALAKRYFGSRDPVGQRITVQGNGTNLFAVVGLVNDIHQASFIQDPEPELYFHCLQINEPLVHVVAKVEYDRDLNRIAAGIKAGLNAIDSRQAAGNLDRFDTILTRSLQVQKFRTYLLTCFAGIALILSAVGIFGFLSYAVGKRTREIGILAALGVPRAGVVWMIMKGTVLVISLGVAAGLAMAIAASRLIEGFLFQVGARDTLTFLAVAAFVGAVAVLAAYLPVRRAARLEVMEALRSA